MLVDRQMMRAPSGRTIAVMRFRGGLSAFALHAGSSDPGAAALPFVRRGPRIGRAEQRHVVAAFNGGFLLSTGAGGYLQEGHVVRPLVIGDASLVIDRSGAAHVVTWRAGDQRRLHAYSVRQNLTPLITHGHPSPYVGDVARWGATLGGGSVVARSALGEDRSGNLVYAAGMAATPADLAWALRRAGCRTGMELDINPEWVQFDVAPKPGHPLRAAIPGQARPADQYIAGWTRDFVVAVARRA